MSNHMRKTRGFTLLEMLLSIAIIGVLAGFSLPVYRTLLMKTDLDIAATAVASSLRRAQALAQAMDSDTSWGTMVENGRTVLFKGNSFAARDSSVDESFDMPSTIRASGSTEIVFSKFTGLPQTYGTVFLTTEQDARNISINEKGTIGF